MSEDSAAIDASPLIYLARAGLFDLLRLAAADLVVPSAVAREILARGPSDPTAAALASHANLRVVDVGPVPPSIASWGLGPGESAVLAWCVANPGCRAVIDDGAARASASALGVPLRGTLALVLLAKRSGRIESARETLARLGAAGMFLSRRVLDTALLEVGE